MEEKVKKNKRAAAFAGVVLICVMVIATLISAFTDPTGVYFRSCLIVTIALPIALWVFIWAYGAMMHKHTIASYDLNRSAGVGTDDERTEDERKDNT